MQSRPLLCEALCPIVDIESRCTLEAVDRAIQKRASACGRVGDCDRLWTTLFQSTPSRRVRERDGLSARLGRRGGGCVSRGRHTIIYLKGTGHKTNAREHTRRHTQDQPTSHGHALFFLSSIRPPTAGPTERASQPQTNTRDPASLTRSAPELVGRQEPRLRELHRQLRPFARASARIRTLRTHG